MKKLLTVIIVIFLIFSTFCGVLAGKEEDGLLQEVKTEMPTGGRFFRFDCNKVKAKIEPYRKSGEQTPLTEFLEEQMLAHNPKIDISKYNVVADEEFEEMLYGIIVSNYKIMAFSWCGGEVDEETGIVINVKPDYFLESHEYDVNAWNVMDKIIDEEYLDAVENIPNSDVVGKMLVLHDLFCEKNAYAKEELDAEDDPYIYTAINIFLKNRAVCQGNATALKGIYDRLNERLKKAIGTDEDIIETVLCANEDHIWNAVKIGGKWYHIDETRDDPVIIVKNKETGEDEIYESKYARHKYFLRSDDAMADHSKDGGNWMYYTDESIECDDKKYEGSYIFNSIPEIYINSGQLITYKDGRYRLEAEYLGEEYPFWSNSLTATKILATDPYDLVYNGKLYNGIKIFSKDLIDITWYRISNSINGGIYACHSDIAKNAINVKTFIFAKAMVPTRVFFWRPGDIEPLCRTIDIP